MKQGIIFILLLGLGFSQTELTTRVYTFPINMESDGIIPLDIQEITGYDLEVAMISIFHMILQEDQRRQNMET